MHTLCRARDDVVYSGTVDFHAHSVPVSFEALSFLTGRVTLRPVFMHNIKTPFFVQHEMTEKYHPDYEYFRRSKNITVQN